MTPIRKGSNPVKIPFAIKSNDRTFAAWANEVVTAIRQLEARIPTASVGQGGLGPGSPRYPFKIRVRDGEMTVDFGVLYISKVYPDQDGKPFLALDPSSVSINSGKLKHSPGGGTVGTITLSASTTYGVWIEALWSFPGSFDKSAGISGDFADWSLSSFSLGCQIVVSTVHTTSSDTQGIMEANPQNSYIFVGRVIRNAMDGAEIEQHLRSDLTLPGVTLPTTIISTDSPNEIYNGTDGGLIVDP